MTRYRKQRYFEGIFLNGGGNIKGGQEHVRWKAERDYFERSKKLGQSVNDAIDFAATLHAQFLGRLLKLGTGPIFFILSTRGVHTSSALSESLHFAGGTATRLNRKVDHRKATAGRRFANYYRGPAVKFRNWVTR